MVMTAFWKALYTVGHDAAFLSQTSGGWILEGTAVYRKDDLPAALHYRLDLAPGWETIGGSINGRFGDTLVDHNIRRSGDGWLLDGKVQAGLEGVVDLDFGFTPATNHPQLRRINLGVGDKTQITVAWMDLDSVSLEPLPQIYERLSERAYDYNSPHGPYRATLQIEENGFVRLYPELWEADPS